MWDIKGQGSPEGNRAASPGTRYTDVLATDGTVLWVKASGHGVTGWAKPAGEGPRGERGPEGPPGPSPTDESVAGYLSTASASRAAADSRYVGKGSAFTTAVNYVYVSPTGADTNDGRTAGTPFATFQAAFDYLALQGPVLQGRWEIIAAAGTYPYTGSQQTLATRSVNRVVVRGAATTGHPAVPTTIIDGTGGASYKHGLSASGIGVRAEFRDLKFVGFTEAGGGGTRIGCVAENESDVLFTNVHADDASWCGIYAFNTVRARVNGGILTGCRSGFIANCTQATVIDTIVRNSTESGIYWSRGSQGHVDYVTLEDNAVGLRVAENSRVDTVGNNFKRNTYAIRTQTGGLFGEGGAPNIFNQGGANAQLQADVQTFAYSGDSVELETATQPVRVAYDRVRRDASGTSPAVLSTPYTLKANRMRSPGASCRVVATGVFTAVTAASTMTVKFGGMDATVTVPAAGANVVFELDVTLHEAAGGHRAFGKLSQGLNLARAATIASGFVPGSDQEVSVRCALAGAGDSLSVHRVDVFLTA